MPAQACRTVLRDIKRHNAAHAGLVLSRYLRISVADKDHPQERQSLFGDAIEACGKARPLYSLAYQRWQKQIEQTPHARLEVRANDRLIIGLGGENVLETGLTLHHIYGTPLIPGTALKGLAAHYCAQTWGSKDAGFKGDGQGQYYNLLFGTTDDSGHIVFHDAWVEPESLADERQGIVRDVMTPHHADYYMAKPPDQDRAPTDSDMPIPVPFLAVRGTFLVAVSSDITDSGLAQQWCDLALNILSEALQYWGVGGKTNAGYGRMARPAEGGDVAGEASKQRFNVGDKVLVKRIPDPKGRDRVWFKAEDGFVGMVRTKDTPPNVEIGKPASLFISSVTVGTNKGYTFSTEPISLKPLPQKRPDKKR